MCIYYIYYYVYISTYTASIYLYIYNQLLILSLPYRIIVCYISTCLYTCINLHNTIYMYITKINPVRRELTFFVSKSCDPDFKQAVKRHRVGTLVGC